MKNIELGDEYIIRANSYCFQLIKLVTGQSGKGKGETVNDILSYHTSISSALEAFLQYRVRISDKPLKDAVEEAVELVRGIKNELVKDLTLTIKL